MIYSHLTIQSDPFSCITTRQIIGTADRKNQVIGFGKINHLVTTAIHSKSSGIIILVLVYFSWLDDLQIKYRQLDGSLLMAVLIALLNLLGAVSPCKNFPPILQLILVFIFLKNLLAHYCGPASCCCTSHRKSQRSFRTLSSKDRRWSQAPC